MPDIRFGSGTVSAIYHGAAPVSAVYYGAEQIWPLGMRIGVPTSFARWTDYATTLHFGAVVSVPLNAAVWTDYEPTDAVVVPTDGAVWRGYAPSVFSSIAIPFDAAVWTDFTPAYVGPTVDIKPPADLAEWTDFTPSLFATVTVPNSATVWQGYAPTVAGGGSVVVPLDPWEAHDYPPGSFGFDTGFTLGFQAPPVDVGIVVPATAAVWTDQAPAVEADDEVYLSYIGASATTTINTGTAAADRYVFAIVFATSAGADTALTISSATIGGVTAVVNSQRNAGILTSRHLVGIISALVPTGTTATVSVTYNRSATLRRITSYRATGLGSNTSVDSGGDAFTNTGSSWSRNIDVQAGGFVLATAYIRHSGGTLSSSNMTRDDRLVSGDFTMNSFSSKEAATQTDKSFTWANSNGSGAGPFAWASLR